MDEPRGSDDDRGEAVRYEIRLKGRLNSSRAEWFGGMSLTHANDGTTVLAGPVADQAALHGLLHKLRDLGVTLISVNESEAASAIARADPDGEPHGPHSNDQETDMDETARKSGTTGVPNDAWRKLALAGGIAYLMTFIFSIPAVFLYGPVLSDPAYILSAGADSQVLLGALFDLITALACIGTAVALYPVIKRQSGAASIGFVSTRIFEAAVIVIGVVCLMAVVNLRQAGAAAGTDASALAAVGQGLVAVRDVTFLVGPGVMPGLNALLLGYVLYRSRLVPRAIPAMGLIGAPLFLVLAAASILGLNEQASVASGIAVIPIFFWELSLGLWLTFKGFRPSAVTALASDRSELVAAATAAPTAAATTAGAA